MKITLPEFIIRAIARDIIARVSRSVGDHTWDPDARIEITLTANECRIILEACGEYREPAEKGAMNELGIIESCPNCGSTYICDDGDEIVEAMYCHACGNWWIIEDEEEQT